MERSTYICDYCGKPFETANPAAHFCSNLCDYHFHKDHKAPSGSPDKSTVVKDRAREILLSKDYLSITDTATLLNVSRPTIYKRIEEGSIHPVKLGPRTIRINIRELTDPLNSFSPLHTSHADALAQQQEYITPEDASRIFGFTADHIRERAQKKGLTVYYFHGRIHFDTKELKKCFNPSEAGAEDWYTVQEIMDKYHISCQHVYDTVSEKKIPKKHQGRQLLISKYDWDILRSNLNEQDIEFCTVTSLGKELGMNKASVLYYARKAGMKGIQRGREILYVRRQLYNYIMKHKKKS